MNRLLFNYRTIVEEVVSPDTFDGNIILGFGIAKRTRIKVVGIESPTTNNGVPFTESEIAILKDKATMGLKMLLARRRIIISPTRPGPYGQITVNAYVPVAEVYHENPVLVETFAGMRFLDITNAMNFAAQKRYDDQFISEILKIVQPTQGVESL